MKNNYHTFKFFILKEKRIQEESPKKIYQEITNKKLQSKSEQDKQYVLSFLNFI